MRVLVTGADGFMGSAVVRRLAEAGMSVTAMHHRLALPTEPPVASVTTCAADLLSREQLRAVVEAGRFDAVCHLAALTNGRESLQQPLPYFAVNVGGTANLLEALVGTRSAGSEPLRVVFASSQAVYGRTDSEQAIREDQPLQPINPYGASKVAAEQALAYEAATGRIGAVSLRCFNVAGAAYGRGDGDRSRLIPMALAVAAGEAPAFPLNGDGSAVREFVHVLDVAEAFLLALHAARPGEHLALNVGGGEGTSVRDVLAAVERQTGRPVPVDQRPPAQEARRAVADIALAQRTLGWTPSRSTVDEMVRDAWAAIEPQTSVS